MANVADDTANTQEADSLDPKVGNAINAAVASHLKRHFKGLGDSIGTILDERLSALGITGQAQGKAIAAPDKPAPDAAMQEVEKLRGELKAQKQKAFEKEVFAEVKSILTGKIRAEALDTALKVLRANGAIKIDARDGSATFKSEMGDVELSEGIAEWLENEGALFAPAPIKKALPVRGPAKAPARPAAGANEENLSPAEKTARALQARGLSII